MNYTEAINYIHSTRRFGSKLGLENMRRLLARMGDPHRKLKYIHVAGTNGKGSTVSFLSHALMESGIRVGTYTSPYIIRFNERIKVDFLDIPDDALAEITGIVRDHVLEMVAGGFSHPTEFEIITCVAFEYYAREKCDIVVLEVGLGGRLDATNIIDAPLYAVITKLGYDHSEYLGNTLAAIASEKAGIIKKGSRVFTSEQEPEALEVIVEKCLGQGCPLTVSHAEHTLISRNLESQRFIHDGLEIEIGLHGAHQIQNCMLAYEVLKDMGIEKKDILNGLRKTVWQGRFEIISRAPLFIIDGAHNPDGAARLAETLEDYFGSRKILFIFSAFKDKDYGMMIQNISDRAKHFFIFPLEGERALDIALLEEEIKKHFEYVTKSDTIIDAVHAALDNAGGDDIIVAFGSLSYIGEVKRIITAAEG